MSRRRNKSNEGTGPRPSARTLSLTLHPALPDGRLRASNLDLVWVNLRGNWSWLVVLPAEANFSTSPIAHGLSQIGARLSAQPIDFIEATNMDLDRSCWLIERLGTAVGPPEVWGGSSGDRFNLPKRPNWTRPTPKTIVSLESPLENPLALPVALAADGIVLCIRRGQTRLDSIRKTLRAVGTDRIICTVLIG